MDWHLPLDNDIRDLLDVVDSEAMQVIKDQAFRQHLATVVPPATWAQLVDTPTSYLRELYPTVYLYGPEAQHTEHFGSTLVDAYGRHGLAVLTSMPSLHEVSSSSFDYLDACLAVQCRPHGEDRPAYTRDLEHEITVLAAMRGDNLAQQRQDSIQWIIGDLIEMTLALDIVKTLPIFDTYMIEYRAYQQRWDIP